MAAFSKTTNRLARWRLLAAGTFAFTLLQLCAVSARADEPTIYVVDEETQPASGSFDIAIALSSDEANAIEPVAYSQTPASTDENAVAEQSIVQPAPEPTAEEVPLSEEIEQLDQLEGPPKWSRILRPITEVSADATLPAGLLPDQVEHEGDAPAAELTPDVGDPRLMGGWGDNVFSWSAAKSWHHPLYFEEVNLERYGYQCHPLAQPLVSGAHFFLTVPTLPYQMTVHPPRECIYTLGHYRPGSCVPWQRNRLPWDARAAAVEASVVVGLVFLIP